MSCVGTVLYANNPDLKFNMDYFANTHQPLLQKHWGPLGLKEVTVVELAPTLADGSKSPYIYQAVTIWESMDHAMNAMTAEISQSLFADIPNFSNQQPMILMGNTVWRG